MFVTCRQVAMSFFCYMGGGGGTHICQSSKAPKHMILIHLCEIAKDETPEEDWGKHLTLHGWHQALGWEHFITLCKLVVYVSSLDDESPRAASLFRGHTEIWWAISHLPFKYPAALLTTNEASWEQPGSHTACWHCVGMLPKIANIASSKNGSVLVTTNFVLRIQRTGASGVQSDLYLRNHKFLRILFCEFS